MLLALTVDQAMHGREEAAPTLSYLDPELRIKATTLDPVLLRRFLTSARKGGPSSLAEVHQSTPEIGATRADADLLLERNRVRPNFQGYLRDGVYFAHLSAQLLDGEATSAEEVAVALFEEFESLRQTQLFKSVFALTPKNLL